MEFAPVSVCDLCEVSDPHRNIDIIEMEFAPVSVCDPCEVPDPHRDAVICSLPLLSAGTL